MDLDVRWTESSFRITAGRDPLGLQTITTDRIMPVLTPGILALSQRARYLSFHLFLLDDYERRKLPASRSQMSDFFRRREYELALASTMCANGCGLQPRGVVGRDAIAEPVTEGTAYARDFSVQSNFGAYGLYYRSPLVTLGLVVPAGTPLGDEPTPVDVIDRDLGKVIAEAYRARIADTAYYREFMHSGRPIPSEVLAEFASQACLCKIAESMTEQELLRQAFFGQRDSVPEDESRQRRKAFALFLRLVASNPSVVGTTSSSSFRSAIWESFLAERDSNPSSILTEAVSEWAALVAREALQEAVSSIWTQLCNMGLARQGPYGMTDSEVRAMVDEAIQDSLIEFPDGSTCRPRASDPIAEFATTAQGGLSTCHVEDIREWVAQRDSISAGLAALLVIGQRLPDFGSTPQGWRLIGSFDGENQPGLLRMAAFLESREEAPSTVGELAQSIISSLVLRPHERIALAKLPEFTFRFRLIEGRLRFFEETMRGHFGPSDIRHESLRWLSEDLGLWSWINGHPQISTIGRELVSGVFG